MNAKKTPPSRQTAQAGDLAQLVGPRDKSLIVRLKAGDETHTHLGVVAHDQVIGSTWGNQVTTHLGKQFIILPPALDDLLRDIERNSQIMYPKDIGYVLVTMGIGPGAQVVEAGTGSGALTIALAYTVGPNGHVYSYERRTDMQAQAKSNLEHVGLLERVDLKQRDISEGFDERDVQAVFLDLPNPEDYVAQVREALMPGGFFGCILPTVNQIITLLTALKRERFGFIEISEIMHRYYKPVAERLRPTDRMTAHTGFLIFARPISVEEPFSDESKPAQD